MGNITPEEREKIESAIREGRLQRVETVRPIKYRERPAPKPSDRQPASKTPPPYRLPDTMSVRQALEWAFMTEKASFDYDEIGATSGGMRSGRGTECLLIERKMIGTTIDTSPGYSEPAEDAVVIASIVRDVLHWRDAVLVAELARAGREPDWMRDAKPHVIPVEWVYGRGGKRGRTGDSSRLGGEGWRPIKRRNKKGVIVEDIVLFTPVTVRPTADQIARARRGYLDWWGHLLTVGTALRSARIRKFKVTDEMPDLTPWREN